MSHDDPTVDGPAATPPRTRADAKAASGSRRRDRGTRKNGKPRRSLWLTVLIRAFLGLFALGVIGLVTLFVIYQRTEIPKPNAAAQQQQSVLYYDDGKTEIARFTNTTREDVPFSKIPEHVRYAFLSAEDRSFYENQGVSPTGMARALWTNLSGGQMQGGSTITQQYVKNYFLSQDRTMSRKLNEVMISLKIDNEKPKDEILTDYLNTIYFGRNAYGIQAASKAYFNKDVSKLTVSEGAFLASIINSPSRLDPASGTAARDRVNSRMSYVLDGMVTEGWLTQAEREKQKMPTFAPRKKLTVPGPNGYIRELVQTELLGPRGLSQQDLDQGGLRITTTISKKAQDSAVRAVNDELAKMPQANSLHVGLQAQKPGDGAIVAVYGGRDPAKEANNVTYQRMQAASGFKTFGLIGALQDGMTLDSTFNGSSPQRFPGYGDRGASNFGNISWGTVTLRKATQNSINTAFLNLNEDIGPSKTRSVAEQAGIPARFLNKPTLANVLGTDSVRVQDMTTAYNTIAGEGTRATPYLVKKVTSTRGNYSYDAKPKTERVFAEDVALNTRSALQSVINGQGGSGEQARALGRPAAGKTGTASANTAVWFNGFTPQLTASVGMFKSTDGGKTLLSMKDATGSPLTGSKYPTEIWTSFMKGALQGDPVEQFGKVPPLKGTRSPSMAPTTQAPATSESSESPTSTEPSTSTESPTSTEPSTSTESPTSTEPSTSTESSPPETSEPSSTTRPEPTKPSPTRTQEPPRPTSTPTRPPEGGGVGGDGDGEAGNDGDGGVAGG